ncbi:MAG: ectonucleotide pyrophosphatase/phosphodiesterase [Cognaticolwellia sp.]
MKLKTILLLGCLSPLVSWAQTPLVLLSIDGFAQHYIEQYQPKALMSLIEQGTSAKALLPVYPSKTFPNHLSIITGCYPSNHGIIHNDFFHREIGNAYQLGDGKNDTRWLTAKPLWHINEMQGHKSAIYFWPESETPVDNKMASYYYPYQHFTPNKDRLDQILAWLRLPESQRPNFIAGYFASVDDAGHDYGGNSPQLIDAIAKLDALLADFVESLKREFNSKVNLVIVSDHGMTRINPQHVIEWEQYIVDDIKAINGSTQLYLYSDNKAALQQSIDLFNNAENTGRANYRIYQYPNYPEHWHLNQTGPAIPDVIIEALPSSIFSNGARHIDPETHGYDPKAQADLQAIFIATGPAFDKNRQIDAFENIHILPILTRALGLKDVNDIDGNYNIAEKIVN